MISGYRPLPPSALRFHTGYKRSNIQYSKKKEAGNGQRLQTAIQDTHVASLPRPPFQLHQEDHQVRSLVLMVQFSHFLLCPQGLLSVRKWWDQHSTWSPWSKSARELHDLL